MDNLGYLNGLCLFFETVCTINGNCDNCEIMIGYNEWHKTNGYKEATL